ncbi:hypothetical protein HMPREF3185_01755 [Porphyromonas somerae]|uniref:Uncharacterized protein n=1 Tax=Porphyromonas somerae TaxID=322095 RepID=A0A134B339_9PORP|nr:hypothetical protein HMPREF3184_01755 [Porphyromonadaceae bacterium KA00676]KXB74354.1 hypothetical protein HMPREF3185_01755 [Porphyromonas somerae]
MTNIGLYHLPLLVHSRFAMRAHILSTFMRTFPSGWCLPQYTSSC